MSSNIWVLCSIAVLVSSAIYLGYLGLRLANDHGSDIYIVTYLFSLALTSTFLLLYWARNTGAIDAAGNSHDTAGAIINGVFTVVLEVKSEMMVLLTFLALVVLPQFLSYLIGGLLGCAVAPVFVGPVFRFVFWTTVKSFVFAAGVTLVIAAYAWAEGWEGMSAIKAAQAALGASAALVLAVMLLYLYRLPRATSNKPSAVALRRILRSINTWASRRTMAATRPDQN